MIEETKRLGTKLKVQALVYRKLATDREVHLPGTETPCVVPWCISLGVESGTRRWDIEGVIVDDPSAGIL
jgi:hypothetical protein